MIFSRISLLVVLLSLPTMAFGENCNLFSLRHVNEGEPAANQGSNQKMKVTQAGYESEELWVSNEILLDGGAIEKAYVTHSKPIFTPEMMEKIKSDPRAIPVLPEVEKAFTTGGDPELMIVFKEHAKSRIKAVTSAHVGKRLAFVLDGKVLMAPQIFGPIEEGEVKIAGISSEEEANEIASRLNQLSTCK